jgi:predicted  nucleic acid-binding Zn-ribbon protein
MPPAPALQAMSELFRRFKPIEDRMDAAETKIDDLASKLGRLANEPQIARLGAAADDKNAGHRGQGQQPAETELKELVEILQSQNKHLESRLANLEMFVYELSEYRH